MDLQRPAGRALRRVVPDVAWLRPNGRNLDEMLKIVDRSVRRQRSYSDGYADWSEFMPGCAPRRDEASIERLFEHLEALFAAIARHYRGRTLSEFHDLVAAQRQDAPRARQPATAPRSATRSCCRAAPTTTMLQRLRPACTLHVLCGTTTAATPACWA